MAKGKKDPGKSIKKLFTSTAHMKYWYGFFYEHSKIKKGTILLESFHGKTINDSPLVCAQEIARLYPGKYKLYYATNNMTEHRKVIAELGIDVEPVDITSLKYTKVLATAEYIISNASLPIYFIRKEGQKYLQTWHGTPLKTLGKKMREGIESMYNVQHNFLQASHIMFPNEFTREAIMEDYNLERLYTGRVLMCGYPRNKVFFDSESASEVRRRYGIEDKTVYAYMPTWRGTSNRAINNTDYFTGLRDIFLKLDGSMRDDQVMYVNFHPIIRGGMTFDEYAHIKPFPADISNYEFLNCTDALVTDYSSVFFDYSLTGKPVVLFMYDYDQYMKDRGCYLDISELPFRKIYETGSFCECIANDKCLKDDYTGTQYFKEFFAFDSPDCTEKLLKAFLDDEDCLETSDYSFNRQRHIKVIKPKKISCRSDLRTLAKVADRDSVVLMYRKWFRGGVGQMLYDDFNDSFDYIITTNDSPRTYGQQVLSRLGSSKAKKRIADNDRKRCFGGLDVDRKYIQNYGVIEKDHNIDKSRIATVDAGYDPGDSGILRFRPGKADGLTFEKAVLLDQLYCITEIRDLTEKEKEDGVVEFSLREALESYQIYNDELFTPALTAKDESGRDCVVCFTDTEKEKSITGGVNEKKQAAFEPSTGIFDLPEDYERANFKAIINSPDEHVRESISGYSTQKRSKKLVFVPSLIAEGKHKIITVRVTTPAKAVDYISDAAELKDFSFNDREMTVKAYLPGWREDEVHGGRLILDSPDEDLTIPVETKVKNSGGGCVVTMRLVFDEQARLKLKQLRWHCRIVVKAGDQEYGLKIKGDSFAAGFRMKARNIQSEVKDGWILYPYTGNGDIFKLCYREKTQYDTAQTRAKEIGAAVLFFLAKPWLRRKEYYMIYEKFSSTAQDNAFWFFRYCMEKLPESERDKFYYVIDRDAADRQYVEKYGSQVIDFMSIRHMLLAMGADVLISTDSIQHFYAWRTKPSFVFDRIKNKKVFFLQHGVTAMKRVDHLFGRSGLNPMEYFATTSALEQEIVVKDFGYKTEKAPVLGFTRWDALKDKSSENNRMILVMPTWRAWLEDNSDEEFTGSDYYRHYSELIENEELASMLEEHDLKVVFYLHPKFASYINTFRSSANERIELISFGQMPLNELMMRCSLLITDYSSVCWDVLFMDKPVIYYHFDLDKYLHAHGSYIDLAKDLPGPVVKDLEGLLGEIDNCINEGFDIAPEYRYLTDRYFAYRDDKNCERTYQFLKKAQRRKR